MESLFSLATKKAYPLEEARMFAMARDFTTADLITISHLSGVKGRVGKGQVGNKIDSARMMNYDSKNKTFTIRIDNTETPEFWIEIPIKISQLKEWISLEMEEEDRLNRESHEEERRERQLALDAGELDIGQDL